MNFVPVEELGRWPTKRKRPGTVYARQVYELWDDTALVTLHVSRPLTKDDEKPLTIWFCVQWRDGSQQNFFHREPSHSYYQNKSGCEIAELTFAGALFDSLALNPHYARPRPMTPKPTRARDRSPFLRLIRGGKK